jgi:hypothetical protein
MLMSPTVPRMAYFYDEASFLPTIADFSSS